MCGAPRGPERVRKPEASARHRATPVNHEPYCLS